jgi:HK97 family phage prohead protease
MAVTLIVGYAAIFNAISAEAFSAVKSFDWMELRTRFSPGCFDSSLKWQDREIKALYSHEDSEIYARRSDGSLRLEVDGIGLKFTMEVDDLAHPRLSGLMPGVRGMSVGFSVFDARTETVGGEKIWTIREAWLHEVSLAENPRFPQTSCRIIRPAAIAPAARCFPIGTGISTLRRRLDLEVAA